MNERPDGPRRRLVRRSVRACALVVGVIVAVLLLSGVGDAVRGTEPPSGASLIRAVGTTLVSDALHYFSGRRARERLHRHIRVPRYQVGVRRHPIPVRFGGSTVLDRGGDRRHVLVSVAGFGARLEQPA